MNGEKKWNGWGWLNSEFSPETDYPGLISSLEEYFGSRLQRDNFPLEIDQIKTPHSRLSSSLLKKVLKILKPDQIKTDSYTRIFYSRGRSLPDTFALRTGLIQEFPDVVVFPKNEKQILEIIKLAQEVKFALIPFGGGTSVVGGVNSFKTRIHGGIIVMALSRMKALVSIDVQSKRARFECGIFGPDLEKKLNESGMTLGHFPQSFEFSTLGGWIAARGAGYLSDFYGKAEDMVLSLRCCLPGSAVDTEIFPGVSEGPLLSQWMMGSEGTLGVITQAELKIEILPSQKKSRAFLFADFHEACETLRECKQAGLNFSMIRISDPQETYYYKKLHGQGGFKDRLTSAVLKVLRYKNPSVMLVITEGSEAARSMDKIHRILKRRKALSIGEKPVASWFESRYKTPYLRDFLLDYNVASDTFETWVNWSDLENLRSEVYKTAMRLEKSSGKKFLLMAHLSHSYAQGSGIYFTVLYIYDKKNPQKEWANIKKKFTDTIVLHGGTVSHHHGIGMDHKKWMLDASRGKKISLIRVMKKSLDPQNIMNPGKMV